MSKLQKSIPGRGTSKSKGQGRGVHGGQHQWGGQMVGSSWAKDVLGTYLERKGDPCSKERLKEPLAGILWWWIRCQTILRIHQLFRFLAKLRQNHASLRLKMAILRVDEVWAGRPPLCPWADGVLPGLCCQWGMWSEQAWRVQPDISFYRLAANFGPSLPWHCNLAQFKNQDLSSPTSPNSVAYTSWCIVGGKII